MSSSSITAADAVQQDDAPPEGESTRALVGYRWPKRYRIDPGGYRE